MSKYIDTKYNRRTQGVRAFVRADPSGQHDTTSHNAEHGVQGQGPQDVWDAARTPEQRTRGGGEGSRSRGKPKRGTSKKIEQEGGEGPVHIRKETWAGAKRGAVATNL